MILPALPLLLLFFVQKASANDLKKGGFKTDVLQPVQDPGNFKLVKRLNSIALYERWVQHHGSQVRELKAEFTAGAADAGNLQRLLKNESRGLRWNNNARDYQVIPGKRQDLWMVYIQYDIPWPMNDLDCLLTYRFEKDPFDRNLTRITFESIESDRFPVVKDVTRITGTKGKWLLEDQGKSLKVTYLITTDRSKKIPRWISDPVVHENLFKTMTQVKKLLED